MPAWPFPSPTRGKREEEEQSKWNTNLLRSIRAGGEFYSNDCNCVWPVGICTWKSMSRAPLNLLSVVPFSSLFGRVGGKLYSNLTVGREYGSIFELTLLTDLDHDTVGFGLNLIEGYYGSRM